MTTRTRRPRLSPSLIRPSMPDGTRPTAPTPAPTAPESTHIIVDMTEFLRFPKVVEWLINQGVEDPVASNISKAQQGALLQYLPAKMTIDINPAAVAGSRWNRGSLTRARALLPAPSRRFPRAGAQRLSEAHGVEGAVLRFRLAPSREAGGEEDGGAAKGRRGSAGVAREDTPRRRRNVTPRP